MINRRFKKYIDKPISFQLSVISDSTQVPCLAIAMLYERIYGKSDEIDIQISSLQSFYKYDKIETLTWENKE